jgi:hypothetical protein
MKLRLVRLLGPSVLQLVSPGASHKQDDDFVDESDHESVVSIDKGPALRPTLPAPLPISGSAPADTETTIRLQLLRQELAQKDELHTMEVARQKKHFELLSSPLSMQPATSTDTLPAPDEFIGDIDTPFCNWLVDSLSGIPIEHFNDIWHCRFEAVNLARLRNFHSRGTLDDGYDRITFEDVTDAILHSQIGASGTQALSFVSTLSSRS